jgi:hypothetical protein
MHGITAFGTGAKQNHAGLALVRLLARTATSSISLVIGHCVASRANNGFQIPACNSQSTGW